MSEFTGVASEGTPVPPGGPAAGSATTSDTTAPAGQPGTRDDGSGDTVAALLRGGPASGQEISVPKIADTFPMFIGVAGGNYVRDKGAHDRPVYNWWPAGANNPAGDPRARTNSR